MRIPFVLDCILRVAGAFFLLIVLVLIVAFNWPHDPPDYKTPEPTTGPTYRRDIIMRLPSPDGRFDAVLVEDEAKDLDDYRYQLYIVAHDAKPCGSVAATFRGAMRNENAGGVAVRWAEQKKVVVEYQRAREANQFEDYSFMEDQAIKVVLRSDIPVPALPGPMIWPTQSADGKPSWRCTG